jgi:uncharacterized DUF497 family protein
MFTTQINMAQHDVHPEEAEQALSGDVLDLDYRVTQDGEERWTALGQAASGRFLSSLPPSRSGNLI